MTFNNNLIHQAYRRMQEAAPEFAGWKIGATNQAARKAVGADGPFYAYLFDERIFRGDEPVVTIPRQFDAVIVEVEICYRLRAFRSPYDNPAETIKDAFAAIELVLVPGGDLANLSLEYLLDNNGAHHGLVLGDVPLPLEEISSALPISVWLNNRQPLAGSTDNVMDHPQNALAWLLNDSELPPDNIFEDALVTTGSCTPVLSAGRGDRVRARVGDLELSLRLE
ncbi:MAG: hypothetical protein WDZ83_14685 [Rhizobiaceae bacterium]